MERENVIKILKYYTDIDGHLVFVRRGVKNFEETYYGLHCSGLGGAPSKTNKISNPTESAVLNVPDSVREKVDAWRAEIKQLYSLQAEIYTEICKLALVEKNIIVDFYIKKCQWVQISSRVHYSETQCKKIRNKALDKLGGFFEQNEVVKKFNYPI